MIKEGPTRAHSEAIAQRASALLRSPSGSPTPSGSQVKRSTTPASAVMSVEPFDDDLVQAVAAQRGIAQAEGRRSIVVKLPNGEELRSPRNLGAHVSRVYLPCTCGEVRSVLVPPVTACDVPT